MRKLIQAMLVIGVLALLPAASQAQRRSTAAATGPKHEFGVDVGVSYTKPENVDGGIEIGTPLDVRVGLRSAGKMMWEPRFTFGFSSVGGTTTYLLTPGVNVLYSNQPGGHRNGMYFTGGAGLILGDNGANNGTAFSVNGGVGWRKPYGTAAWRYEVGFQWNSESTDLNLASTIRIGGRIGISLWH